MGKIKSILIHILSFIPTALPRGSKEFDDFVLSIFQIYNLPDMPSYRNAVASMVMHLGPLTHRKSKRYFAASILKAMANQVAYQKIQDYKAIMEEEEKKEKEAALAAAIAEKSSEQVV